MSDLLSIFRWEKAKKEKHEVNIHNSCFISKNNRKTTIIYSAHKRIHTYTNVNAYAGIQGHT